MMRQNNSFSVTNHTKYTNSTLVLVTAFFIFLSSLYYVRYNTSTQHMMVQCTLMFMFSVKHSKNTPTNTHTNSETSSAVQAVFLQSVCTCVAGVDLCVLRFGAGVFWGQEVKRNKKTACFLSIYWEEVRAVCCISYATMKNLFLHQICFT